MLGQKWVSGSADCVTDEKSNADDTLTNLFAKSGHLTAFFKIMQIEFLQMHVWSGAKMKQFFICVKKSSRT